MESLLFIAIGGALGALGRFWTGLAASCLFGSRFPVGTLIVNVAGSFLIGLTASAIAAGRLAPSPWDDLVMQGFCGALTTFSTRGSTAITLSPLFDRATYSMQAATVAAPHISNFMPFMPPRSFR